MCECPVDNGAYAICHVSLNQPLQARACFTPASLSLVLPARDYCPPPDERLSLHRVDKGKGETRDLEDTNCHSKRV